MPPDPPSLMHTYKSHTHVTPLLKFLATGLEPEMADLLRTARTKAPEFQKLYQYCRKVMLEERAKIQRAKVKAVAEK